MPDAAIIISTALALSGAALLAVALLEIAATAWLGFGGRGKAFWLTRWFYPLGWRAIRFAGRKIKHEQLKNLYFWSCGWLLLGLLKIVWAGLIIAGFSCWYLAISLPEAVTELSSESWRRQIVQAVAFGILIHAQPDSTETVAGQPTVFILLSAVQKVTVFVYLSVTAAEVMLVYRQSKRMQVSLYGAAEQFKNNVPFEMAKYLCCNFGSQKLEIILKEWQLWASELEVLLRAYPALPYLRTVNGHSWVLSLEAVLHGAAEILVGGNEPVKHSARAAFAAARRAASRAAALFGDREPDRMSAKTLEEQEVKKNDDAILSAEFVGEIAESCHCSVGEREMLEVWQFTYQSALATLKSRFAISDRR